LSREKVGSTKTALASYTWMGPRPWERTHANFTETRYWDTHDGAVKPLYDPLGRLLGVRTTDEGTGGTNLGDFAGFRYGWDRVGNLMFEQRLHEPLSTANTYRTRAHRTDLLGRLGRWREGGTEKQSDPTFPTIPTTTTEPDTAVASPNDGETWALDLVGNWDKKAAGALAEGSWPVASTDDYAPPNPLHQYTSVTPAGETSKPFAHDFLGQLRTNGRRNQEYGWDSFGRLTKVCSPEGETCSAIASYRYDALNRRVEKVVEAPHPTWDRVTRFYYDGWRAVEERAVQGEPGSEVEYMRARYGFGVGLDEVVWMDRDRTSSPDETLESRYFFAHDLLGSVVAATEDRAASTETLQVVERYTYSAYGEVSVWTQGWSQASGTYGGLAQGHSAIGMPYLYTGQRQDSETGLWYFKNRVYDGESGRFLRRDLIGYGDGPNLYRYAGGRPNAAVDPLGLSTRAEREMARVTAQMAAAEQWSRWASRWNGDVVSRHARGSMPRSSTFPRMPSGWRNGPGPGIDAGPLDERELFRMAEGSFLGRLLYDVSGYWPKRGPLLEDDGGGKCEVNECVTVTAGDHEDEKKPKGGGGGGGDTGPGTIRVDPSPDDPDEGTTYPPDQIFLVARLIYGEAAGQPYIGKIGIAWVVRNRIAKRSREFGLNLQQVVTRRWAFEAVTRNSPRYQESAQGLALSGLEKSEFVASLAAAELVLNGNVVDPTGGALWYMTPAAAETDEFWSGRIESGEVVQSAEIGGHLFFTYP
jgi:RHS repeat-associated protein